KCYFAAELDLDDAICQSSNAFLGTSKPSNKLKSASVKFLEAACNLAISSPTPSSAP
ncbi:hypothetical protein PPACK8108_LOCUS22546, partial [Phakopsora pachyrhizi]